MDLLTTIDQAWISREIYVAAIKGCTREKGAKAALADRAGITPQFLSYLLAVDTDLRLGADTWRQASVSTARRLTDALPLPLDTRRQVFDHMVAARETREHARRNIVREIRDVPKLTWEMRHLAHQATHSLDQAVARRLYGTLVDGGNLIVEQMAIRCWPIDYVELSLCLHEALCVLDDPLSALQFARYGRFVLDWASPAQVRGNEDRVQDLEVNLIRAVGVAYNNLNLPREAAPYFERACRTTAFKRHPQDWVVHIARDKLSTLSKLPRFRLSDVDRLVGDALDGVKDSQDDYSTIHTLLLKAKLGECYTSHGCPQRSAESVLTDLVEQAERTTQLGALHMAIIYRTCALLCRQVNDWIGFEQMRTQALDMAEGAGLIHQARTIRHDLFSIEMEGRPKAIRDAQ